MGPSMREQAMVLVGTIAPDAPGQGHEKGTIVRGERQGESQEWGVGYM